ncbi:hypothetical protein HQI60_01935, partial [Escherichia coli]|nr:hypothetical protein [Escherichia coli]
MSKKFTKTVLSTALAGVLFGVSFGAMADTTRKNISDNYYIEIYNENNGLIKDKKNQVVIGPFDIRTGHITTFNRDEWVKKVNGDMNKGQSLLESVRYTIDAPSLKKENLDNITAEAIDKIKTNVEAVSKIITSETAPAYNAAVRSGMSSENALKIVGEKNASVLLNEFGKLNKNVNQLKNATTFALDENGEI